MEKINISLTKKSRYSYSFIEYILVGLLGVGYFMYGSHFCLCVNKKLWSLLLNQYFYS